MKIADELQEQMGAMGEASYPDEGCGILIGNFGSEIEVVEVRAATNLRKDRARDRYILDPKDTLQATKDARQRGLEVVGFWHTHPDHPARPSQYDADHAWPEYVYVVVAVHQGTTVDVTAWILEGNEGTPFRPEPIAH
jgi:proteasome lid subunit RPN8/RPN11